MPAANEKRVNDARIAAGINVLAGLFLVLTPFALGFADRDEGALWNSVIVGLAVTVLALIRLSNPLKFEGMSWINFFLGIWLLFAPFIVGFAELREARWSTIAVALVMLAMGGWSAVSTRAATGKER